jgi:Uma2 family endonuclease
MPAPFRLFGFGFTAIVATTDLGPVVELADTQVLGACAERRVGSSPARAIAMIRATLASCGTLIFREEPRTMAPRTSIGQKIDYPTSDGRPMAETDWHRDLMTASISTLKMWYAKARRVYVSGNLLLYYVPGNKRKHVSPDVFVVRGISKRKRPYYLLWDEGKSPEMIIELTSKSTRKEDLDTKFKLYRDILRVQEYFLFDPFAEYLKPPLRGFRLTDGQYLPIQPVEGRLPSEVTGLHLERDGTMLRLYDPVAGKWLPTPEERITLADAEREEEKAGRLHAEAEREEEKAGRVHAEAEREEEKAGRLRAEAEAERFRQEIELLRQRLPKA